MKLKNYINFKNDPYIIAEIGINHGGNINKAYKLIDAAKKNIFLMVISNNDIYSISHENTKVNYDKLIKFRQYTSCLIK